MVLDETISQKMVGDAPVDVSAAEDVTNIEYAAWAAPVILAEDVAVSTIDSSAKPDTRNVGSVTAPVPTPPCRAVADTVNEGRMMSADTPEYALDDIVTDGRVVSEDPSVFVIAVLETLSAGRVMEAEPVESIAARFTPAIPFQVTADGRVPVPHVIPSADVNVVVDDSDTTQNAEPFQDILGSAEVPGSVLAVQVIPSGEVAPVVA